MKSLWRAMRLLKPYRWLVLAAFLAMLFATAASLIQPQFSRLIVDRGIASRNVSLLVWLAMGMIGFAILHSLANFAQGALMARTANGLSFDLRNQIYAKIQALSFSYHDKAQTGQLMTRATSDVDMVQGFIGHGLLMVSGSVVMMAGSLAFLFITNWQLALVMTIVVPLVFGIFATVNRRIWPLFRQVQERLERLNIVLQESLVGVRVVKAFAREPYEARRFAASNQELYDINIRIARTMAVVFPMIFMFSNLTQLAVYWIGGLQVINGQLTAGAMLAFVNYMMMVFWPILGVSMIITMISQSGASAERVFEVLDAQSEVVDKPGALPLTNVNGRVAFEDVSFRYFESGEVVLDQVSFTAEPGQVVALLGATGSGKSTIINLIPRFYDVTEGQVTIDGTDVRDVTIESLRSQIGIVFQETTLFAGTVRENIAFGRPDASDEEVISAAQAAEAHDFITEFAQGYDTLVGERGVTLSGGQKQRVAIARALLLNPRILILDDSTSSVDLETEYRIQTALSRLMEGRTSFVIAQRIATVLNADQILVLDKGRIVAQGTHEELMRESEIYAEIYQSQLLQGTELEAAPEGMPQMAAPAAEGHGRFDGPHPGQVGQKEN